jgi:MFS family permease
MSPAAAGAVSPRAVLGTTCASHGLIHVYELSVPALLILIQAEFGADDLQLGTVATVYAALFGLGALPAGYLVDRWGSKPLLLVCLWGGALSMLGMALAPSLVAFTIAASCMGLCLSTYHPAGTALITHAMAPSGRVFALHGMAGNLGVAGASVIAGTLGALFGWRWAIGLLAILGLGLGLAALRLDPPPVHEIRSRPGHGDFARFSLLLVATAFMGMVYRGLTTFLPKFLAVTYAHGASRGSAVGGLMTTAALMVGLGGMYVAGRSVDRGAHSARVFLTGAVAQVPLLLLIGRIPSGLFLPLFMGVAFFHFFTQPAGNHLVAELTPPRLRGLGYGVYFLMTFGAGSFGAALGGWVSKRYGLERAFPALVVVLVPSILAMLALILLTRRRAAAAASPEPPAPGL